MDAQAILAQVARWARARNGLRTCLVATAAGLAATLAARTVGTSLPEEMWIGIPILTLVGWGWPLSWERLLLWAGRRLGVGERLAAANVLTRYGASGLLGPLLAEIGDLRPRLWRLLLGPRELGASALVLGLALSVGLVPLGTRAPVGPVLPMADAALVETTLPEPTPEQPELAPPAVVPTFPAQADFADYSPYLDLLAAVLGLEDELAAGLLGDDLAARLAREEGLLRRLAERLAEIAPGGLSAAERAELAPLAREVARADLRERLERLLDQEDEAAAHETAEALAAVITSADRAAAERERAPEPTEGAGDAIAQGPVPAPAELNGEMGMSGADRLDEGEGFADLPGTAAGAPPETANGDWEPVEGLAAPIVAPSDAGPMRAYIVPGIPGEPPATVGIPTALSPQEVEVILRARQVPPELRELVRRYFELIGGNP